MAGRSEENPNGADYLRLEVTALSYGLSVNGYKELLDQDKAYLKRHPQDPAHSPLQTFIQERLKLQSKLGMNDYDFTELMAQEARAAKRIEMGSREISPVMNALVLRQQSAAEGNYLHNGGGSIHGLNPNTLNQLGSDSDSFSPETYHVKTMKLPPPGNGM